MKPVPPHHSALLHSFTGSEKTLPFIPTASEPLISCLHLVHHLLLFIQLLSTGILFTVLHLQALFLDTFISQFNHDLVGLSILLFPFIIHHLVGSDDKESA